MNYDETNIFAKILRGEIPARTVYEDAFACAFHDVTPQAPVYVLVIPKGPFVNLTHFLGQASQQLITGFWHAVHKTAECLELPADGFRLITNEGLFGGQEVPHFHVHLLGGKPLGPMLNKHA